MTDSPDQSRQLMLDSALTIYTAADTRLQLLAALHGALEVHLDLSAVEEIDCAGLQLLLATSSEARRHQIALHLEGVTPPVSALLQQLGISVLLPLEGAH